MKIIVIAILLAIALRSDGNLIFGDAIDDAKEGEFSELVQDMSQEGFRRLKREMIFEIGTDMPNENKVEDSFKAKVKDEFYNIAKMINGNLPILEDFHYLESLRNATEINKTEIFDRDIVADLIKWSDEFKELDESRTANLTNFEELIAQKISSKNGEKLMNKIFHKGFMEKVSKYANKALRTHCSKISSTPKNWIYHLYSAMIGSYIYEQAYFLTAVKKISPNESIFPRVITNDMQKTLDLFDKKAFFNAIDIASNKAFAYSSDVTPQKFIKFNVLFQNLITTEKKLNGGSCDYKCEWITRKDFKYQGCEGEVRDCKTMPRSEPVEVVYSKNWSMIHENPSNGSEITKLKYHNTDEIFGLFGYNCDVCQCTCDQLDHKKTERFLYAGKIKAEEGFVFTGARFAKQSGVIFVQFQVAQLDERNMVKKDTLRWMEAPKDLTKNVMKLSYDLRRFLLNDLTLDGDDAVMTGFQFIKVELFQWVQETKLTLFRKPQNYIAFQIFGTSLDGKKNLSTVPEDENVKLGLCKHCGEKMSVKLNSNSSNHHFRCGLIHQPGHAVFSSTAEDFGQETLPYFYAGDVTFNSSMALSGFGFDACADIDDTTNQYVGYLKPILSGISPKNFLIKTKRVEQNLSNLI